MAIPMEIGSLIGVILLAALVLAVTLLMPYAIGKNLSAGHQYREQLDEALSQLRLSNMLGYLGIDKSAYLHKQSSMEVKNHMAKCEACDEKSLCDETLASVLDAKADLGFCANINELKKIEERQSKEASSEA